MLRLLTLNYEYPPIGGGGGNAHQHILRSLTRYDDLTTTLIAPTPKPEGCDESSSPRMRHILLPIKKQALLYWRRSEIIRYLWDHYRFLGTHLRKETYDLCHVFFGFPTGLLAYLNRSLVPYLVSVRGSDVPGYNKRFALDYVILGPLLKQIYHQSRSIVANSSGLKALFDSQYPQLCAHVIPNGVDTDFFKPCPGEHSSEIHIVTVARLIPRKGIDLLINACVSLIQKETPLQCHIIGEGPEKERLMQLADQANVKKYIHFHGMMAKKEIAAFLPHCDIFALPSYAEGMSNAALEAMACGLALVLTDTGGSRELISGNGLIISAGSVEDLTKALSDLIPSPSRLKDMQEKSRQHAHNFSWDNVADQYYDLYKRIASH